MRPQAPRGRPCVGQPPEASARMGKAAALAWILFGIIFLFTWLQLRYQRRWVHYEAERE